MPYNLHYLGRNLNERPKKALDMMGVEMAGIMSQAAARGMLNSGSTLVQFWQAAVRIFESEATEAIKFSYTLTGETDGEPYNQVAFCTKRMVDVMVETVQERASTIVSGSGVTVFNKMAAELLEKRERLLDDYKHGMMGSDR